MHHLTNEDINKVKIIKLTTRADLQTRPPSYSGDRINIIKLEDMTTYILKKYNIKQNENAVLPLTY